MCMVRIRSDTTVYAPKHLRVYRYFVRQVLQNLHVLTSNMYAFLFASLLHFSSSSSSLFLLLVVGGPFRHVPCFAVRLAALRPCAPTHVRIWHSGPCDSDSEDGMEVRLNADTGA